MPGDTYVERMLRRVQTEARDRAIQVHIRQADVTRFLPDEPVLQGRVARRTTQPRHTTQQRRVPAVERRRLDRGARDDWGLAYELIQSAMVNVEDLRQLSTSRPLRYPSLRERPRLAREQEERQRFMAMEHGRMLEQEREARFGQQWIDLDCKLRELRKKEQSLLQALQPLLVAWNTADVATFEPWLVHFLNARKVSDELVRIYDIVCWFTKGVPNNIALHLGDIQEHYHVEADCVRELRRISVALHYEAPDDNEDETMLNDYEWAAINSCYFGDERGDLPNGFSKVYTTKQGLDRVRFIIAAIDVRMIHINHIIHAGGIEHSTRSQRKILLAQNFTEDAHNNLCALRLDIYPPLLISKQDFKLLDKVEQASKKLFEAREVLNEQAVIANVRKEARRNRLNGERGTGFELPLNFLGADYDDDDDGEDEYE